MRRFVKRNYIDLCWGICVILAISFFSIVCFCLFNGTPPLNDTPPQSSAYNLILPFVVILLLCFWFFYLRGKIFSNQILSTGWKKGIDIGVIILFILMLIVFAVVCKIHFISEFAKDHLGGIFVLLIGLATILGTYWAIRSIINMKHTITSYPQLYEALTELINNTSSKEIRIVSYFILPGYWQVENGKKRERFKNALSQAKDKIKIACINPEQHLSILIDVAKKGTRLFPKGVDAKGIIEFQRECEGVLSDFMHHPKRLKWKELPYYYFFVTEERAVIVTPVGLPVLNSNIDVQKVKEISNKINDDSDNNNANLKNMIDEQLRKLPDDWQQLQAARVDTLGFETTDQHIVDMLWGLSEKYYNSSSSIEPINDSEVNNNQANSQSNSNDNTVNVEVNSQSSSTDNTVNIKVNQINEIADILVEVSDKVKINVKV